MFDKKPTKDSDLLEKEVRIFNGFDSDQMDLLKLTLIDFKKADLSGRDAYFF